MLRRCMRRYEYEESMDKPTIFFSHSSIDRDYISELQKGVNERTSGTVNIFQSSDGESIPFGNNWVHKIEENLHKAKIMFVFVSPESLSSSWIYFESGFAYAKNVKVIPIGIKGVDIGKLRPPINLLQGFNLVSEAGMNNIISILNDEFNCSFSASFNTDDYEKISIFDENSLSSNTEVFDHINYITFNFPSHFNTKEPPEENKLVSGAIKIFQEKLNKLDVQSAFSTKDKLHAHGLIATVSHPNDKGDGLLVKIDPFMLKTYEKIISNIFDGMYEKKSPEKCWFNVFFNELVSLETTDFKVSSKLSQVDVELSDFNGNYYKFNGLNFTLEPKNAKRHVFPQVVKENLRVIYDSGNFLVSDLADLLTTLTKIKVIVN